MAPQIATKKKNANETDRNESLNRKDHIDHRPKKKKKKKVTPNES